MTSFSTDISDSCKRSNDEANTKLSCVIPLHKKTLAVGTLKSILNQANISVDEFIENL